MRFLTTLALGLFAATGAFAQEKSLTLIVGGGVLGDWVVKAFVEPFEQETGIKVNRIHEQASAAQIKLKHENKQIDFDLTGSTGSISIPFLKQGIMKPIDYSKIDQALLADLPDSAKREWGVQFMYYAWVLGLNAEKFPEGQPAPGNWAEFWDVEKFPGTRTLQSGELGFQGPFEEALLADGVTPDKLYPLDVDRAFASLDKIKPSIRKWWKVGSEMLQLFQSGGATMGMGFEGRFAALANTERPARVVWNQAKMTGFFWSIPEGAKNVEEAYKFIEFTLRPDRQAAYATMSSYGPANPKAFEQIAPEVAKKLVTNPENQTNAYAMQDEWYAEIGPDGRTNSEMLAQRWNEWITK